MVGTDSVVEARKGVLEHELGIWTLSYKLQEASGGFYTREGHYEI